MKYYASFSANGGSTYCLPVEFTNKTKALRYIRERVWAEHFQQSYNRSSYVVKDENHNTIFYGAIIGMGKWVKD